MDRIRQIWIESQTPTSSNSSFEDQNQQQQQRFARSSFFNSRPPPLRTSSTYDDDDAFNNVALNLLSRHEMMGSSLSIKEVLQSTLVSPKQIASFYDGLCLRMDRSSHLSPKTASLVESIEKVFGRDLKAMTTAAGSCGSDGEDGNREHHTCYTTKPYTPRHTAPTTTTSRDHYHHKQQHLADKSNNSSSSRRFFFSEDSGGGFFRKRRIQNIDWKLAEAVQQVEHLTLDGMSTPSPPPPPPDTTNTGYEAPSVL